MKKIFISLTCLFLLIFSSTNIRAATYTWTGAGNASASANWSGSVVPQAGDKVVFNNTSTNNCNWNINPSLSFFTMSNGFTGTVTLSSNLTITNDITIASGTLNAGSSTITVGGNWYLFNGAVTSLGDINEDGNVAIDDVINISIIAMGIDPVQSCSDINTDGIVNMSDVVLALRMSLGFNSLQSCSGGLFNAGSSTVVLNGTAQTISGNNTFYNLTKITSSASTLSFKASSIQTVANTLTLNGSSGLLSLRSTSSGSRWNIDPQGNRNVSFVDVKDSKNINTVSIVALASVDSINNINWSFGGSECVCLGNKQIHAQVMGNGGIYVN